MHRTDVRPPPVDADLTSGDTAEAKDAAREFGAAGADKAIEPEDLALAKAQVDVAVSERGRDRPELENGLARVRVADPDVGDPFVAADHQRHQSLPSNAGYGLVGGRDPAVAQYRHAVAEREHFLELVTDEDDRDALTPQPAQNVKKSGCFVAADRCGRLIQQQNLSLERERLGDLDELHLRDRERRHLGARVDGAVEQVEICARLPVHLGVIDHRVSGRQVLKQNVLAHRNRGMRSRSDDARSQRQARHAGGEFDRLTVKQQMSRIGLMTPVTILMSVDFPAPFSPMSA